jgi:hypothetical protein
MTVETGVRMNWQVSFSEALAYDRYLQDHGSSEQRGRWEAVYNRVLLTVAQRELLEGFTRQMNVLCLSGTWCGDCVNQCPILQRFAEASPQIDLRFLDRDTHPALRDALAINGGHRVPMVVFLSEDLYECGRMGDRTVSKYRELARTVLGAACPTGIVAPDASLLAAVTSEWLDEFERIQLMLRLSPRLRQVHGD